MEKRNSREVDTIGNKSYLSKQFNLISLTTSDLFTDEEYDLYKQIIHYINGIEEETEAIKENNQRDPTIKIEKIEMKRECQKKLAELIRSHDGTPRTVQIRRLFDTQRLKRNENNEIIYPEGISWRTLKTSRKISEFMSEESRAMGLNDKEVTYDKIIIKWKSLDILKQIVLDGFNMNVLMPDGSTVTKHYIFMTSSAGQLRTDKIQVIEKSTWARIQPRLMCGLDFNKINEKGGINVNKLMAYIALNSSATDVFEGVSIDNCIVIDDCEWPVKGLADYIDNDYNMKRGIYDPPIKHTDGIGMMLPCVSRKNFMVRGPWIKGLLTSFDYIKFCKVHNIEPEIEDIYKKKYNLIKDDIRIIFFKSQFKLYNYYDSWDEYKYYFKKHNCTLNVANFEEDYIGDTTISYQMLQTIVGMTDAEIRQFTKNTHDMIESIAKDSKSMLRTLKADENSDKSYKRALALYNELLRESYFREMLKEIKNKWMLDAKSGRIKCKNKRLYVIPDMYAMCEHIFLGIDNPKGLLKDGEVACRQYRNREEVDCLRSPHLYFEHAIRTVVKEKEIYDWLYTDGIYTSCHDLISKILQFDCDGDQLNVVADEIIIESAKREIREHDIVPILYELGKAPPTMVNNAEMFNGLKRAHEYSGIGEVSNSLTKLWNRPNPDRYIAACLCFYNNLKIDAAKTGVINGFNNYPDLNRRMNKAIGGAKSRMPWFFQFSKNGRRFQHLSVKERKKYAKENNSTMNRIAYMFDDIGNINMNKANVPPFNWQMMISDNTKPYYIDAVRLFCSLDDGNKANLANAAIQNGDAEDREDFMGYEFVKELIIDELTEKYGSLDEVYPTIVKYLFAGNNAMKPSHKQMFWRVFGDTACRNLEKNVKTYTVCDKCGMKIPSWVSRHDCPKSAVGFFECIDCGAWCKRIHSKQVRCEPCQEKFRKIYFNQYNKRRKMKVTA